MSASVIVQTKIDAISGLGLIAKSAFTFAATSLIVLDLRSIGMKSPGGSEWIDLKTKASNKNWTITEDPFVVTGEAQYFT